MENDNNNGGIGSASSMGSFEGSVSADAPGSISADRSNIESSMSANNGGGITDSPQVGTLDLNPIMDTPTSAPIIDSQHLDLATSPAFLAPDIGVRDFGRLAVVMGTVAGTGIAIITGSPAALPAAVVSTGALVSNADVLGQIAKAVGSNGLQVQSTGVLSAFTTASVSSAPMMGPDPVDDYWQWMGISQNSGGLG